MPNYIFYLFVTFGVSFGYVNFNFDLTKEHCPDGPKEYILIRLEEVQRGKFLVVDHLSSVHWVFLQTVVRSAVTRLEKYAMPITILRSAVAWTTR